MADYNFDCDEASFADMRQKYEKEGDLYSDDQVRQNFRQQQLYDACESEEELYYTIQLAKANGLRDNASVLPFQGIKVCNASSYAFPYTMRYGGSEAEMDEVLEDAQRDIEEMVVDNPSCFNDMARTCVISEPIVGIVAELDVDGLNMMTEDVVEIRSVTNDVMKIDDIYYRKDDSGYLASVDEKSAVAVFVELVLYDDDHLYTAKNEENSFGGQVYFPDDSFSSLCRWSIYLTGKQPSDMRKVGVCEAEKDGLRYFTVLYVAPKKRNEGFDVESCVVRPELIKMLGEFAGSNQELDRIWEKLRTVHRVKMNVDGNFVSKTMFRNLMKKESVNQLFAKIGFRGCRYFDIFFHVYHVNGNGCDHTNCTCQVLVKGQRQFLGYKFLSRCNGSEWVRNLILDLRGKYECSGGRVRQSSQIQKGGFWNKGKLEWVIGGVRGFTGWQGLDVKGGLTMNRGARVFDKKQPRGAIVTAQYSFRNEMKDSELGEILDWLLKPNS